MTATPDLKIDYAYVRYSYSPKTISLGGLSLAYSYGSSVFGEIAAPFVGHKASTTQDIVNNLPQWMKLRQSYNSTGWKLINSWGMNFDNVVENTNKRLLDLNLTTTDSKYLSLLHYVDIDSKELLEPRANRNLLFNSSFAIKDVARSGLPSGWESHYGNTGVLSFKGSPNVGCIVSSNGRIKVSQQVVLDNVLLSRLCGSVYYKGTGTGSVTLVVAIEKTDGTNITKSTRVESVTTEWTRMSLTIDINSSVYRINYSIVGYGTGSLHVASPQLERNSLTDWSKSSLDSLPYYPVQDTFNSVVAVSTETIFSKIPIFGIQDERDFIDTTLPTRLERVLTPSIDLNLYTNQAYGRKVSQLNEVTRTEFAVVDGEIVERSLSPTIFDIYGRYSIKDLRYYEDLTYGTRDDSSVSTEYLYCATRGPWIYAVCKETVQSETVYTLKIVRAVVPPNGEAYLECFIDFDLNLDFDTVYGDDQVDQEIDSLSFSDVDSKLLVITTTANQKYYYKLYFDYYYFNRNRNRLYTIEAYPHSKIQIT